jgi:N-acetylneuraminic acid mutarotase
MGTKFSSTKRWGATATVVDGRIYVCGGADGNETLADVESFSPIEG